MAKQKKRTQIRKPTKQQKQTQTRKPTQKVGFFNGCAEVAWVLNMITYIMLIVILTITLLYILITKKGNEFIPLIVFAIIVFVVCIGLTFFLYRYFPTALCVLFLMNLVFSLLSGFFLPKQ